MRLPPGGWAERRLKVNVPLGMWCHLLEVLPLVLELEQSGQVQINPGVYEFGAKLAMQIFDLVGMPCDSCGCTREKACAGGCSWEPLLAMSGIPRCTRCAGGPRILTAEDPAFQETLAVMRGGH